MKSKWCAVWLCDVIIETGIGGNRGS